MSLFEEMIDWKKAQQKLKFDAMVCKVVQQGRLKDADMDIDTILERVMAKADELAKG